MACHRGLRVSESHRGYVALVELDTRGRTREVIAQLIGV
jgi:hypothetical protein